MSLALENASWPAVILVCSLSVAVASLLAALFLHTRSSKRKTRKRSSRPAPEDVSDHHVGGTSAIAPPTVVNSCSRTPDPSLAARHGSVVPASKRKAADANPAANPPRAKEDLHDREGPRAKAEVVGPELDTGRELWFLRTLAVKNFVDRQASASKPMAADLKEALKRRIWALLDDRPRLVATGCADGMARIFDLRSGKTQVSVHHDFSSRQALRAVHLTAGPELLTASWDGKWHKWDQWPRRPTRAEEFVRGERGVGHDNLIVGVALSRDGTKLVVGCTIGCVLVYRLHCPCIEVEVLESIELEALKENLKMGDFSELYLKEAMELGGVELESHHMLLPEASFAGFETRRDISKVVLPAKLHFRFSGCLTSGHKKAWRTLEHQDSVLGIALSVEGAGEFVYSASRDLTVRKWDLMDGKCVHIYKGHTSMVKCVSVNASFLASGSDDRSLRIWSKDDTTCRRLIPAHKDFVRSVSLCTLFQERLASSGDDNRVILWNVVTGDRLREFNHKDIVCSLILNGSLLVTAAEDRQLRVWDTESATCLKNLRHPAAVTAVSVL